MNEDVILTQYRWFQKQGYTPAKIIKLVHREQVAHGEEPGEYERTGDGAFQALHDLYDLMED